MSALAGIAHGKALHELGRSRLEHYRDDGPVARTLGRALARVVPVPPGLLVLAGMLPGAALIAARQDDVSNAVGVGAICWLVLLAGVASGRSHGDRSAWISPGLLRLAEYGGLLWLGALASDGALPGAFAILLVLAFRHYDLVYRDRYQGMAPSRWVDVATGGWDGRLLLGCVLLVAGLLPGAFYVLAGFLGVVVVLETTASWVRFRARAVSVYEDEEDEGQ